MVLYNHLWITRQINGRSVFMLNDSKILKLIIHKTNKKAIEL